MSFFFSKQPLKKGREGEGELTFKNHRNRPLNIGPERTWSSGASFRYYSISLTKGFPSAIAKNFCKPTPSNESRRWQSRIVKKNKTIKKKTIEKCVYVCGGVQVNVPSFSAITQGGPSFGQLGPFAAYALRQLACCLFGAAVTAGITWQKVPVGCYKNVRKQKRKILWKRKKSGKK